MAAAGLTILASIYLGAASAVFACVPQAKLVSIEPRASGPPGTEVTVNGLGFDAGPVEIRWNGPDGDRLGTTAGPNFSVPVTVPDVAEGLYSVVVLSRTPGGGVGNTGTAAFEVITAGQAPPTRPADPGATAPRATRDSPVSALTMTVAGVALLAIGALGGVLVSCRRLVARAVGNGRRAATDGETGDDT